MAHGTGAASPEVVYPGLFDAADQAAQDAQAKHSRLSLFDLSLLVVAAVTGGLTPLEVGREGHRFDGAALATAAVLVIGLVANLVGRIARYDKRWFSARAVAESVKTESWRFMMGVAPHAVSGDETADSRHFTQKLHEILAAEPDAHLELAAHGAAAWVNPSMLAMRARPLRDRAEVYRAKRLDDQRNWYASKAAAHRRAEGRWFWLGTSVHAVAVVLALLAIPGELSLNAMGVLTTVAANFFAWNQLRDHQHLAQSYTMIAHELSAIAAAQVPTSEPEISTLVEEVERTISREHTLWVSRRQAR